MKSGKKWWKVGKSGKKWWKVGKSGEKWPKLVKSDEKWGKVGKTGKKWGKVVKSGKKWGKVGKSGETWGKVGKSGEKWWKMGKSGEKAFGGHFGWPKIIFDCISRHFRSICNFFFFFKMAASSHCGSRFLPKSIGTDLYSRSVARSNMKLIGAFLMKLWSAQAFSSYFHKMAVWRPFWFSDFLQSR